MQHMAPQRLLFSCVISILCSVLLTQLLCMCLARQLYCRHRLAFTLFNRLSRFVMHAVFMCRPLAPAVPALSPASLGDVQGSPGDLVPVILLAGPLSFLQQPLLYFLPTALQMPLCIGSMVLYVLVWCV